jgi:hypothetical protein
MVKVQNECENEHDTGQLLPMRNKVERRKISPGLAVIDARAMRAAIEEFKARGRVQFLKRYGFSRSSKFYFIFEQRLYDTKVLVAAAYRHATGKMLRHTQFGGGAQTSAFFVG